MQAIAVEEIGNIAGAPGGEVLREQGIGLALQDEERQAADDQLRSQRCDIGADLDLCDQDRVPQADQDGDQQHQCQRHIGVHAALDDPQTAKTAGECAERTDRHIAKTACLDQQHLANTKDDNIRVLDDQVCNVHRPQDHTAGEELEYNNNADRNQRDGIPADIFFEHFSKLVHFRPPVLDLRSFS